jgi:hypothetical protein
VRRSPRRPNHGTMQTVQAPCTFGDNLMEGETGEEIVGVCSTGPRRWNSPAPDGRREHPRADAASRCVQALELLLARVVFGFALDVHVCFTAGSSCTARRTFLSVTPGDLTSHPRGPCLQAGGIQ